MKFSAMDIDVELAEVQAELYCAEKELRRLEAELNEKVGKVASLQKKELTLLQRRSQKAVPVPGSGGGLLVTAVWDNESTSSVGEADLASDVVEECLNADVQSSTQEVGSEAPVQFSQPISDISISEKRVKVTRSEAFAMGKDKTVTNKEAAEAMLCQVLNLDQVDLTSEDLEEFENCIAKVAKRIGHLQTNTKKGKKGIQRPDDTFLSTSMFEDLQQKVKAKKTTSEQENEDLSGDVDCEDEGKGKDTDGGGDEQIVYRKNFTDLVPHSKDQKKRAAPLLLSLSEWCRLNGCDRLVALGFMLHSYFPNKSTPLARFGWQLFTQGQEALIVEDVPHTVALWVVERLNLGRGRYTDMRLCLLK